MSTHESARLIELAQQWLIDDPDAETCAELTELLAGLDAADATSVRPNAGAGFSVLPNSASLDELTDRFGCRLAFGTAGLRGQLGAGSNRMNSKVVMQTSAGFAEFLLRRCEGIPSVVIGFDARLKSEQFAHDTAEVLAGAGLDVTLLPGPVPTPVTAFAVRHLGVSAGVMITASHNPPQDNGYKVYLGDSDHGSQIAPPVDAEISELIEQAAAQPLSSIARSTSYARGSDEIVDAYVRATASSTDRAAAETGGTMAEASSPDGTEREPLKIVYTAMHGVGYEATRRVFEQAGLPELISVPEQQLPDGHFPTVLFPNPEEPGALDLAIALAEREQADLIVAHDPDADRLAVALPSQDRGGEISKIDVLTPPFVYTNTENDAQKNTTYLPLTGNQLGLLLGWECAERDARLRASREDADSSVVASYNERGANKVRGALAATIVSSPSLAEVAKAYDLDFVQTLSGFKWVSRVEHLVFGFEEALGYLVNPEVIRDKDGISAAVLLAQIAVRLHAKGKTLWDRLDEASERFGHFASDQVTLRLENTAAVEQLSARIRSTPPTRFGEVAVASCTDFLDPVGAADGPADNSGPNGAYGGMPVAANVMRFDLADGSRVMIRPSGTEPKLKIYLDASCVQGTVSERKANAEAKVAALRSAVEKLVAKTLTATGQ